MPRAMWSGVIGFGMVSIPVKLYAATESKGISFHLLHDKCQTRIKEVRWCPSCDRQVEWSEIVKGFEYSKGNYVPITEEEMEKLPLPSKNLISIAQFVNLTEIDPVYFEKSYYLEPDDIGTRPFALFMKSLEAKSMVAVGTVALRSRERLCVLRPMAGTLLLCTLYYPDEIRVLNNDVKVPQLKLSKEEMNMAANLIDLMAQEFDPSNFQDHYRQALQEVIDAKLEGVELNEAPLRPTKGQVVDLMEALRNSVNKAKSGASRTKPKRAAAAVSARNKGGVTARASQSSAKKPAKKRA